MFHKILIANRGEIALRIIRACREMGIRTVIAHSTADAASLPVRLADESVCIGPPEARGELPQHPEHHLGRRDHRQRGHPSRLRAALGEPGVRGDLPGVRHHLHRPLARKRSGSWATRPRPARWPSRRARPWCPAARGRSTGVDEAQALADSIGYPVIVKAAAGGGGRGMRIVREPREAWPAPSPPARRRPEPRSAPPSSTWRSSWRRRGTSRSRCSATRTACAVHLGERDCSVQRRHQKLLEESPAPALAAETRAGLYKAALAVANAVNYVSAGTVEFLVDRERAVLLHRDEHAHPGRAPGHRDDHRHRPRARADPDRRRASRSATGRTPCASRGHAIECRINAEDPEHFVPSPGPRHRLASPRAAPASGWTAT